MDHTVDQSHVRIINRRIILNKIVNTAEISRAELARELHISKSAMTDNIASLLEIGIIEEGGMGSAMATGGRRPIMLKFKKDYCYIIAIDLNYEDAVFVLMNLGGDIRNQFTINISQDTPYEVRLDLIRNAVNMLMNAQGIEKNRLAMIALSAPGVYNSSLDEYLTNKQFADWRLPKLARALGEEFATQIMIENDVNAAAYGELRFGAGKNCKNALYISCGLGLGAGLLLNGSLYTGSRGSAGEIASFILDTPEGGTVTLEEKTNVSALKKSIEENAPEATLRQMEMRKGHVRFGSIVQMAKKGDPHVTACIRDIAALLGRAISNMVSLLNVEIVIIGGAYLAFSQILLPDIGRALEKYAFAPAAVTASSLEHNAGISGLFVLAQNRILEDICNGGGNASK